MQKSLWKERLTSQLAHLVMGRKLTTEGNDCLVKILTQYFHFLQILKCEWKASKDLKSTLHSKHVDPLYYTRKLAWTLDWPVLKYCRCVPIRWFWLQSCIIITCTYSVILWPSMMEGWSFSNLFLKLFFTDWGCAHIWQVWNIQRNVPYHQLLSYIILKSLRRKRPASLLPPKNYSRWQCNISDTDHWRI